jgi:hypothetical protein
MLFATESTEDTEKNAKKTGWEVCALGDPGVLARCSSLAFKGLNRASAETS